VIKSPVRTDPLLVDLYQLTMLQAYFDAGMNETAVFEFFVRRLPRARNFLLAAGLEQALDYLETLSFEAADIERVAALGGFHDRFLDWLGGLRFTGDVHAMPEGTVFFPDEPILRVTAPLPQAQLVETRLINLLHFQSLIASKAARCCISGPGKLLVDFGLRRAHGAEAGLLAARAAYLAGFGGTATVAAGIAFGIPVYGTMAHSYVQACGDEILAFERYAHSHPDNCVLLIDTYDTEVAARKVAALAPRLRAEGIKIKAVRIDSGDLAALSVAVRRILDEAGCEDIGIFVSGGLDEHRVADLVARGAPIGGLGIGTDLDTSGDAPNLDCAYKLEEYAGRARRKRSAGKATWPGRKQVFRASRADGVFERDVLALDSSAYPGERLLRSVMVAGKRVTTLPSLAQARTHAQSQLARLPERLRGLSAPAEPYRVDVSQEVLALAQAVDRETS
jgi:nicotinate phosphoribosyltransferase